MKKLTFVNNTGGEEGGAQCLFPSSTDVIILLLTLRKTNRERTIKGNIIVRYIEQLSTTSYQLLSFEEDFANNIFQILDSHPTMSRFTSFTVQVIELSANKYSFHQVIRGK